MAATAHYPTGATAFHVGPLIEVETFAAEHRAAGADVEVARIIGPPAAVEELVHRARLGDAELAARKARRKGPAHRPPAQPLSEVNPEMVDVDELVERLTPEEFRGWVAMSAAIRQTIGTGAAYVAIPGEVARRLSPAYDLGDLMATTAGVSAATVTRMDGEVEHELCGLAGFRADDELGVHYWCLLPRGHPTRHGWEIPRLIALDARTMGYAVESGYGGHELLDLDELNRVALGLADLVDLIR